MFFVVVAAASLAVTVCMLRDGAANASNRRLVVAWIAAVVALHAAATAVLLAADTDWDDPASPNRLGPLAEPMMAAATVGLSAAFALFMRRRAVLYVALATVPVLGLFWLPLVY